MSRLKLKQRTFMKHFACAIFLGTGMLSCGGGTSPDNENGKSNANKQVATQLDSDSPTREQAGESLNDGNTGGPGFIDGNGKSARFNQPTGLAADADGTLFIADSQNHVVRKLDKSGTVSTFSGTAGLAGNTDGNSTDARFSALYALALDHSGNLYATDQHAIRKISPQGAVTTLAGMQQREGNNDGSTNSARFKHPLGIAADTAGNVYVADTGNHTIRKITSDGNVITLAGNPGIAGLVDGNAAQARFNHPNGITLDSNGNLFVSDRDNHVIRKISSAGLVTTLRAENSVISHSAALADAIVLESPQGIAADANGMLYVVDAHSITGQVPCAGTGIILRISQTGQVDTLAGTSKVCGSADGTSIHARFNLPQGISLTATGELFIADTYNHTIRKIGQDGYVTTIAGAARTYE